MIYSWFNWSKKQYNSSCVWWIQHIKPNEWLTVHIHACMTQYIADIYIWASYMCTVQAKSFITIQVTKSNFQCLILLFTPRKGMHSNTLDTLIVKRNSSIQSYIPITAFRMLFTSIISIAFSTTMSLSCVWWSPLLNVWSSGTISRSNVVPSHIKVQVYSLCSYKQLPLALWKPILWIIWIAFNTFIGNLIIAYTVYELL